MAQALRSKIGSILLRRPIQQQQQQVFKRAFSADAGSSAQQHEDLEEAIKWRNVTIAGYVVCTLLGIYSLAGGRHEEAEERKEYSYLHIRNKEFPWGPDGLFEYKHGEH